MNNEFDVEKVYFTPGDLVVLKQEELASPIMIVQEKVTRSYKQGDEVINIFKGIKCRWFDKNMVLQEATFSSKDLKHYK